MFHCVRLQDVHSKNEQIDEEIFILCIFYSRFTNLRFRTGKLKFTGNLKYNQWLDYNEYFAILVCLEQKKNIAMAQSTSTMHGQHKWSLFMDSQKKKTLKARKLKHKNHLPQNNTHCRINLNHYNLVDWKSTVSQANQSQLIR